MFVNKRERNEEVNNNMKGKLPDNVTEIVVKNIIEMVNVKGKSRDNCSRQMIEKRRS